MGFCILASTECHRYRLPVLQQIDQPVLQGQQNVWLRTFTQLLLWLQKLGLPCFVQLPFFKHEMNWSPLTV